MIRTGMRLTEQSLLLAAELPHLVRRDGYHRFRLHRSLAKGTSERWIYVPSGVLADIHEYVATDRRVCVERAQRNGIYHARANALILDSSGSYAVSRLTGNRIARSLLTPAERRELLVEGEHGLEPAALWIAEDGRPMSPKSWQSILANANKRCAAQEVELRVHAHMLRHSYAVITLEQLQRGHLAALGQMSRQQRTHYERIFGDPLDWVRRRLGHRSVETTHIYLDSLAELEMETRLALVPDEWQNPSDATLLAVESQVVPA